MGKRITVSKMLTKRLAESKLSLKLSAEYNDLTDVLGGIVADPKTEEQYRKNKLKDIEEIEYLLHCLKNRTKFSFLVLPPVNLDGELYEFGTKEEAEDYINEHSTNFHLNKEDYKIKKIKEIN